MGVGGSLSAWGWVGPRLLLLLQNEKEVCKVTLT